MNSEKVEGLYNTLLHLRIARPHMTEIFECEYHIANFEENRAIIYLNNTILKNLASIRTILQLTRQDITVVDNTPGVYMSKSIMDEIDDLYTLRACLIIIACSNIKMGSIEELAIRCK